MICKFIRTNLAARTHHLMKIIIMASSQWQLLVEPAFTTQAKPLNRRISCPGSSDEMVVAREAAYN